MSLWSFKQRAQAAERDRHQERLATQGNDVRQSAAEEALAGAKRTLGEDEVAAVMAISDEDEVDLQLADEIAIMKARDPREYARLLASLPDEDRAKMQAVERRYGV
jgi:hypothetical protein